MLIPKQMVNIAKIAGKDKAYPAHQCVCIERDSGGRPVMLAYDGARAIAVSWNELAPENWPAGTVCEARAVGNYRAKVVADDLVRAGQSVPSAMVEDLPGTTCTLLDEKNVERAKFFATDTMHHATYDATNCTDRAFPDVRGILHARRKRGVRDVRVAINAVKLGELLKVMRDISDEDMVVLSISQEGDVSIALDAWNKRDGIAVTAMLAPMGINEADWKAHENVLTKVKVPEFDFDTFPDGAFDDVLEDELPFDGEDVKVTLEAEGMEPVETSVKQIGAAADALKRTRKAKQ